MAEKTFLISDLHLGIDAPENLYQRKYHEAGLKAALRHIAASARETRDFVILGDWFDMLAVPPSRRPYSLSEVIAAHPGLFEEQRDGSGDFVTLFRSLRGGLSYVNGNHDQFVSVDEVNAILEPRCGRRLAGLSNPVQNEAFGKGSLIAEHGHMHTLLFRARSHLSRSDPPFGTFITRMLALICSQELARLGRTCAPELKGGGEPAFGFAAAGFAAKEFVELALGAEDLAQALLDQMLFFAHANKEELAFILDDGSKLAASAIPDKYRDLWTKLAEDLEPLMADAADSLKKPAEKRIAAGARIVAMGHTHRPLLQVEHYPSEAVYVNTGFFCPALDSLDSGEKCPTFAEIEHRRDADIVLLRKVDRSGRVSTLNSAELKVDQRAPIFGARRLTR
jgi:UDP-2,3-diacylglucosamine pyrophosphatase LpxH